MRQKPLQTQRQATHCAKCRIWTRVCLSIVALGVLMLGLFLGTRDTLGIDIRPSWSLLAQTPASAASYPTGAFMPSATALLDKTPAAHQESSMLSPKALFRQHHGAVAVIRVYNEAGDVIASGSGFNLTPDGVIATNLHLVERAHHVQVEFPGIQKFSDLRVLAIAPHGQDLVLLQLLDATSLPRVQLSSGTTEIGDRIFVISHPEGFIHTLSEGLISGIRRHQEKTFLQTTAPISQGSSGGMVLNTAGHVVGIISMSHNAGQNINFCVPVQVLSEMQRFDTPLTLREFNSLSE